MDTLFDRISPVRHSPANLQPPPSARRPYQYHILGADDGGFAAWLTDLSGKATVAEFAL